MALSLAAWKSRISTDLRLILGSASDQLQTDILARALRRMIRKLDRPYISASLYVTATAGPYSVPATINKLVDVRDNSASPASMPYIYDSTVNTITFVGTPDAAGTWTCYGTPAEARTNITVILAAVKDDWEDILWAYCKAYAFEWANNAEAINMLMLADRLADDERKSRNRMLDTVSVPQQYLDTKGTRIGTSGNSEGFDVSISDELGSDL
jgi:hypothetical protein